MLRRAEDPPALDMQICNCYIQKNAADIRVSQKLSCLLRRKNHQTLPYHFTGTRNSFNNA